MDGLGARHKLSAMIIQALTLMAEFSARTLLLYLGCLLKLQGKIINSGLGPQTIGQNRVPKPQVNFP
jgi:hypothetical protein